MGTGTPMFIAAVSTTAKLWKEPITDEWIKKMWYIYIHNGVLLGNQNEILPFATMWMELEGIMLSEISQRKTNTI